jgi:hypothetical protein
MGSWYWIGVAAGVGTGVGVAIGALIPEGRPGVRVSLAAVLAVAAGIGVGLLVGDWAEAAAGGIGGLLGTLASVPVVAGALRRGGTRIGLAVLVALGGVIVAGIAFIPVVGYAEAVAIPLFAHWVSRRRPDRHAGLRILAKD